MNNNEKIFALDLLHNPTEEGCRALQAEVACIRKALEERQDQGLSPEDMAEASAVSEALDAAERIVQRLCA